MTPTDRRALLRARDLITSALLADEWSSAAEAVAMTEVCEAGQLCGMVEKAMGDRQVRPELEPK